jgi:hypothetical protein
MKMLIGHTVAPPLLVHTKPNNITVFPTLWNDPADEDACHYEAYNQGNGSLVQPCVVYHRSFRVVVVLARDQSRKRSL